jgi:hypothetical protein
MEEPLSAQQPPRSGPPQKVHFEPYLTKDFPKDLMELIGTSLEASGSPQELRKTLELLGKPDEVGVVCKDVEKTADYLRKTYRDNGMHPFFLGKGSPAEFFEYDEAESKKYTTRIGFGFFRETLIELAEPGTGSDLFSTVFEPNQIIVHHLGFYARGDNLERPSDSECTYFADWFASAGIRLRLRALVSVFGFEGRVTIYDTAPFTDGIDIEFLDFRLLAKDGPEVGLSPLLVSAVAEEQILVGPRVLELG